MQTRHTRLEKFILAEPVSMVIFCILAAIFMVCTALFLLRKTNPCQAQLCPAACGSAQPWPMCMSSQTLFCFTGEPHPSLGGLSLALCLLMGSLRASAASLSFAQGGFSGVLPMHWSSCEIPGWSVQARRACGTRVSLCL